MSPGNESVIRECIGLATKVLYGNQLPFTHRWDLVVHRCVFLSLFYRDCFTNWGVEDSL
jgi:hypothetical protein